MITLTNIFSIIILSDPNDFERYFINSKCTSIELQMINMFLIMYADDTVLLADLP